MRTSMSLRDRRIWKTLDEVRNGEDNLVDDKGFLRNLRPEMALSEAELPPEALRPPPIPRSLSFLPSLMGGGSVSIKPVPVLSNGTVGFPGLPTQHHQNVIASTPFRGASFPVCYSACLSSAQLMMEQQMIQQEIQKERQAMLLRQERLAQLEVGRQRMREQMMEREYRQQVIRREMAKQQVMQQQIITQEGINWEILRREVQQQEMLKQHALREQMIAEQQDLRKKEQVSHERLLTQERHFEDQLLAQYKLSGLVGQPPGSVPVQKREEETKSTVVSPTSAKNDDVPVVEDVVETDLKEECEDGEEEGAEESDDENDLIF